MPDTGLHLLFGKAIYSSEADYKEPVYKLVILRMVMILPINYGNRLEGGIIYHLFFPPRST